MSDTNPDNAAWICYDYFDPPGFADPRGTYVESVEQLKEMLWEFSQMKERLVSFESAKGFTLGVCIGGPFGTIEYRDASHSEIPLLAIPRERFTAEGRYFSIHGESNKVDAMLLMPVGDVIEIVSEIFQTGLLGDKVQWADWREWMNRG